MAHSYEQANNLLDSVEVRIYSVKTVRFLRRILLHGVIYRPAYVSVLLKFRITKSVS